MIFGGGELPRSEGTFYSHDEEDTNDINVYDTVDDSLTKVSIIPRHLFERITNSGNQSFSKGTKEAIMTGFVHGCHATLTFGYKNGIPELKFATSSTTDN